MQLFIYKLEAKHEYISTYSLYHSKWGNLNYIHIIFLEKNPINAQGDQNE